MTPWSAIYLVARSARLFSIDTFFFGKWSLAA